MSKQEQLDAAIASLQASAKNISTDLNTLNQQIADGTVTDESVAKLQQLAATFQTLADITPGGEEEAASNEEASNQEASANEAE